MEAEIFICTVPWCIWAHGCTGGNSKKNKTETMGTNDWGGRRIRWAYHSGSQGRKAFHIGNGKQG